MGYRKKTDNNHQEIIDAFRKLGYSVKSLHAVGQGFPDLLIAKNGVNILIEVKQGKGKLQKNQEEFFENWRGIKFLVASLDDVVKVDKSLMS